jgi:methionyl aminopeptidase
MPRGTHTSTDGDGSLGDNSGGADDDDDDASSDAAGHSLNNHETVDSSNVAAADKPKKRKKPNKKKKKKGKTLKQTSPPRVKLSELFPSGDYPKGEFQDYNARSVSANGDQNLRRVTDAEKRHDERHSTRDDNFLSDYRKGAEVHRQVRRWVKETARPGVTLTEIAVGIEDGVRALLGHDGLEPGDSLKGGMGFPTGLALNHCVAHYTPNPGQKDIVLQHQDVMKVDFGVHVNGWIVDSAFTMSFDPTYDDLLTAVKEATNAGIRVSFSHFITQALNSHQ